MDTAIVTGADKRFGLRISQKLIELGYKVYGLSQDFSHCHFRHPDFIAVECDLTRRDQLESAFDQISSREHSIVLLVHALGYEAENSFEGTRTEAIEYFLNQGLLAPILLTRLCLPSLVKWHGQVINIRQCSSYKDFVSPLSAALEGLTLFNKALFEEVRDTGVKVCTVTLESNSGERDPKGKLRMNPQSEIDNGWVADAVASLMQMKGHNLVSDITVRPQGKREEPLIPTIIPDLPHARHDVQLPPLEKRSQQLDELIPTPERKRPTDASPPEEAEGGDEEEDEDDELDLMMAESRNLLRKQRELAKKRVNELKNDKIERNPDKAYVIPVDESYETPAPEKQEEDPEATAEAKKALAAFLGISEPVSDTELNGDQANTLSEDHASEGSRNGEYVDSNDDTDNDFDEYNTDNDFEEDDDFGTIKRFEKSDTDAEDDDSFGTDEAFAMPGRDNYDSSEASGSDDVSGNAHHFAVIKSKIVAKKAVKKVAKKSRPRKRAANLRRSRKLPPRQSGTEET